MGNYHTLDLCHIYSPIKFSLLSVKCVGYFHLKIISVIPLSPKVKAPSRNCITCSKSPIIYYPQNPPSPISHIKSKISTKITAYIFFIKDNTITANPKKQKANRPFFYPFYKALRSDILQGARLLKRKKKLCAEKLRRLKQ